MKTERRHALQTNWLADHLGRWLDKVKPYTNRILAGLCAVVAGLVIWQLVAFFGRSGEQQAWRQFEERESRVTYSKRLNEVTADLEKKWTSKNNELGKLVAPINGDEEAQKKYERQKKQLNDEMAAISKEYDSQQAAIRDQEHQELVDFAKQNIRTLGGQAAARTAADKDLREGTEELLTDPINAREKLDRAEKLFQVIQDNASDKLERQRAQFALATLYETRLRVDPQHKENDDVAKAKRAYEDLVKQNPPSYCKPEAERRLAAINVALEDPKKNPLYGWMSREIEKRISEPKSSATPPPEPVDE